MALLLRRLARILGLTAVITTVVGLIRSVRPRPKPVPSGTASWPPLVEPDPAPTRTGPVQFTAESVSGNKADDLAEES